MKKQITICLFRTIVLTKRLKDYNERAEEIIGVIQSVTANPAIKGHSFMKGFNSFDGFHALYHTFRIHVSEILSFVVNEYLNYIKIIKRPFGINIGCNAIKSG